MGNIQIMFMIHLSRICPLAIYCKSIPQRALMCNINDFAKWIPIYDTCCLSQNISTSSSSLIVSCDVFEIFLIEVHSYTISKNWSHRLYMLLSKHSFGIFYDFILDIMSYLFLFTSCVCMILYGSSCPL